jgi:hypothetical protein
MSLIHQLFETGSLKAYQTRVQKIVQLQQEAQEIEDASSKKKQEGNFRRMLDALYWEILEHLCLARLDEDQANFDQAEKLLMDFGILSEHQFNHETCLDTLETTLGTALGKTPYDNDPIYTLSEWASIWQMNSQLFDQNEDPEPSTQQEDWIDDEKATKFLQTRLSIYKKLLPMLKTLPGSNLNFLRSLLSGQLDKQVEVVLAIKNDAPQSLSLSHRRLISLRNTMIDQLKASIGEGENLKLVALLEKISEAFVKRNISKKIHLNHDTLDHKSESHSKSNHTDSKKKSLISTEISLIKGFLPIGGMEGREFFTSPILKETEVIIHKRYVGDTLNDIRQCDPHIPKDLPIIIIPYRGSGFFEWDKNTLVIPTSPSVPKEEAIIRAAGNYRILTDQLEQQGEMKKVYEKLFEKGSFKNRFLQDYVQWVTHMSQGHRKIMSLKKFDFFQDFIGPKPQNLLCAPQLVLTPKASLRRKIREHHTNSSISQNDYLDLTACYWLVGDHAKATQYSEMALSAGMPNPKVFLIYGYTLKHAKDKLKAAQMFKSCLRYYKGTLWGAYAARELERL